MQHGDRLICAFVETQSVDSGFKLWPLHITIVPWFRSNLSSRELAVQLKSAYINSHPITVKVLGRAKFGYKKQKTVNLLEAEGLRVLEGQTRRYLHSQKAWVVDEADHTRKAFRPHITMQNSLEVHEGDEFTCDRLYIVSQHGNYKLVDDEILL